VPSPPGSLRITVLGAPVRQPVYLRLPHLKRVPISCAATTAHRGCCAWMNSSAWNTRHRSWNSLPVWNLEHPTAPAHSLAHLAGSWFHSGAAPRSADNPRLRLGCGLVGTSPRNLDTASGPEGQHGPRNRTVEEHAIRTLATWCKCTLGFWWEFGMGLRPTYMDENRVESVLCRISGAWDGKGCMDSGYVEACGSLIWKARSEPIFLAPPILAGRVVARDGV